MLFPSCSFLEERTTTSISESTVYATKAGIESAIYGAYSTFVDKNDCNLVCKEMEILHSASGLYTLYIANTPLSNVNYATQYLKLGVNYMATMSYSRYSLLYQVICRANNIIENLPSSPVDEEFKARMDGEARLLRAYAYFCLVRTYGDVPLLIKSPTNTEEAHIPRTPFWKVYNQIIKDLKVAFENMRTYSEVEASTGLAAGRPCNYAAESILSEVYLTIGTLLAHPDDNFWDASKTTPDFSESGINSAEDAFTLALQTAEHVIETGPYELAPTFARLFRWTIQPGDDPNQDWKLKERVFMVNVTVKSGAFSYLAKYSLPDFPQGTAQVDVTNPTNKRWKPSRYVFQHWCETYPGSKGTGSNNKYIWVTSSDPRLDATFFYDKYISQKNNVETEVLMYPNNARVYAQSLNTEVCFKKYLDPTYNNNQGNADLYVMRYAGVILNAAEAAANLSKVPDDTNWAKAYRYIEMLHKRARTVVEGDGGTGSPQPKWEADRFTSEADPVLALRDAIFWERVFETMLEGHEFYDTHRHGAKWLSRVIARPIEQFLLLDQQRYSSAVKIPTNAKKGYTAQNFGDPDYKFPSEEDLRKSLMAGFPNEEMVINPNINPSDQNPYFWE